MSITAGDIVTFSTWSPHSRVGKVVDRAVDDLQFFKVRCFSNGKERWYHEDSLQLHVPEVTPEQPWEAFQ